MNPNTYIKKWYGENEPTIADKIKSLFRTGGNEPLAKRAVMAHYRIKSALSRIRAYVDRLNERDKELFEKAVESLMRKDEIHAKIYVNEVAEIRKVARQLLMVEYVLEQASLRLETFIILGNAFGDIVPVVGIIKEASNILKGIAPDLWIELNMAVNELSMIMAATGIDVAAGADVTMSEEARKIFEEAKIVAEQRMKEKFPELPAALSGSKESAGVVPQTP